MGERRLLLQIPDEQAHAAKLDDQEARLQDLDQQLASLDSEDRYVATLLCCRTNHGLHLSADPLLTMQHSPAGAKCPNRNDRNSTCKVKGSTWMQSKHRFLG